MANAVTAAQQAALAKASQELTDCQQQMNRLYELLEQGVYSPEVFAQRSALVLSLIHICAGRLMLPLSCWLK